MDDDHMSIEQLVQNVVAAADEQRGTDISTKLRDALSAMAPHSNNSDARQLLAAKSAVVRSPIAAGLIAMWLGAVAESGRDPAPVIPSLFAAMLTWSGTIRTAGVEGCSDTIDDELETGLQWLGQGLVAHLSRCPDLKELYSTREDVLAELDRTEHLALGCLWVAELLRKKSGELLVVHVAARQGYFVAYENISNCFHLFTLLQGTLPRTMPGCKTVNQSALAAARGESMAKVDDEAWWHYGRGDVPESNIAASVWGELGPQQIPIIDGVQVLLLWPAIFDSRRWDGGFFMPFIAAAPSRVTFLNQLTAEELDVWWAKIGLPPSPSKPRWKFW